MVFGYDLQLTSIMLGGFVTLILLAFQMLVGLRIIKFKGRTHTRVHRWGAWTLAIAAAGHGLLGLLLVNGWQIG